MSRLRLLHLIHTPRHSGAEMIVYELCRLHSAWGHDCAVASFSPPQPEFLREVAELEMVGVSLFFPERTRVKLGRTLHYRNAVRRFQPDAVFGHSELPSLYGRFATGFGRDRILFSTVMHAANNFSSPSFAMVERLTRLRVDDVIAVSEDAIQNYIRRFSERVPVSVIQNGIDIDRFGKADRQAARRNLGIDSRARLALQVGRICDTKRQLLSLSVMRSLLATGEALLWFAGLAEDRAYKERLRDMTVEWGIDRAVRFLGSRADVPDLLAAADLYLMPSRQEAHSVAILEALVSGIPIVASDIPAFSFARGMPSVRICGVEDEHAWRQAAREMLAEPRATRDIGAFSIESTAQAYLNVAQRGRR